MVNKMVLQNILHRPVRTAVSILAVAIEVGMVMRVRTSWSNPPARRFFSG
jgi:hypothetical protein